MLGHGVGIEYGPRMGPIDNISLVTGLGFSIDFQRRPYNILALQCQRVIYACTEPLAVLTTIQ